MGRLTSRPAASGFRLSLFSLLLCSVFVAATRAQDLDDVTISGRIADGNGASVVGARVVATLKATGASRTIATDEEGRFRLVELAPGAYAVRVSTPIK